MTLGRILHNDGQVGLIIEYLFEPEQAKLLVQQSVAKYRNGQKALLA